MWREEVTRRRNNGGKPIIPKIIIKGRTFSKEFNDIEVVPHNTKADIFKRDVTTALDVILSLSDQGNIPYELAWYESIGSAGIVQSYWVEAIDQGKHIGRCGFVYAAGS